MKDSAFENEGAIFFISINGNLAAYVADNVKCA